MQLRTTVGLDRSHGNLIDRERFLNLRSFSVVEHL